MAQCIYSMVFNGMSPLPLRDLRDVVPHVHHAVHRCWRSVW